MSKKVNGPNPIVEKASELVIDEVVKNLISYLIGRSAFFAMGPVKAFVSFIAVRLFSWALRETILGINLALIEYSVNAEATRLRNNLRKAHNPDLSDKERLEADEKIKENMRDLIRIGRSKL